MVPSGLKPMDPSPLLPACPYCNTSRVPISLKRGPFGVARHAKPCGACGVLAWVPSASRQANETSSGWSLMPRSEERRRTVTHEAGRQTKQQHSWGGTQSHLFPPKEGTSRNRRETPRAKTPSHAPALPSVALLRILVLRRVRWKPRAFPVKNPHNQICWATADQPNETNPLTAAQLRPDSHLGCTASNQESLHWWQWSFTGRLIRHSFRVLYGMSR